MALSVGCRVGECSIVPVSMGGTSNTGAWPASPLPSPYMHAWITLKRSKAGSSPSPPHMQQSSYGVGVVAGLAALVQLLDSLSGGKHGLWWM